MTFEICFELIKNFAPDTLSTTEKQLRANMSDFSDSQRYQLVSELLKNIPDFRQWFRSRNLGLAQCWDAEATTACLLRDLWQLPTEHQWIPYSVFQNAVREGQFTFDNFQSLRNEYPARLHVWNALRTESPRAIDGIHIFFLPRSDAWFQGMERMVALIDSKEKKYFHYPSFTGHPEVMALYDTICMLPYAHLKLIPLLLLKDKKCLVTPEESLQIRELILQTDKESWLFEIANLEPLFYTYETLKALSTCDSFLDKRVETLNHFDEYLAHSDVSSSAVFRCCRHKIVTTTTEEDLTLLNSCTPKMSELSLIVQEPNFSLFSSIDQWFLIKKFIEYSEYIDRYTLFSKVPNHMRTMEFYRSLFAQADAVEERDREKIYILPTPFGPMPISGLSLAIGAFVEQRLNAAVPQTTHTASVHDTVAASLKRLDACYALENEGAIQKELDALQAFGDTITEKNFPTIEQKIQQFAKSCIKKYLVQTDYLEPQTGFSFAKILALIFLSFHDTERLALEMRDHCMEIFIQTLANIQTEYGVLSNDEGLPTCSSGAVNALVSALSDIHSEVKVDLFDQTSVSERVLVAAKNTYMAALETKLKDDPAALEVYRKEADPNLVHWSDPAWATWYNNLANEIREHTMNTMFQRIDKARLDAPEKHRVLCEKVTTWVNTALEEVIPDKGLVVYTLEDFNSKFPISEAEATRQARIRFFNKQKETHDDNSSARHDKGNTK